MRKNILELGRPQMTIWHMRIPCWKPKATNKRTDYVILVALPLQRWLHERASILRYNYIACLVIKSKYSRISSKNEYQGFLLGWGWPVPKADDLPTIVVRNVRKIRGLNLPGIPWATSACCGRPLPFLLSNLRKSPFSALHPVIMTHLNVTFSNYGDWS